MRARVRTGEAPFNGKQFLRMEEVAAYFEVTPRTVYRWVDEGLLPAYKLGGCLRVKTSDLEVFEEAARRE